MSLSRLQALAMWGQLMQYNSPEQAPNSKYCGVWEDAFTEVGVRTHLFGEVRWQVG